MKTLTRLVCLSAVVVLPAGLMAQQAQVDAEAFCQDSRAAVQAYCADLAKLQSDVNEHKTADVAFFRADLNQLDPSQPAATYKFVTAINHSLLAKQLATAAEGLADNVATAALSSKPIASSTLADAGQARLDRQLSAPNNANGTTSLVSKTGSAELLSLGLNSGALTRSVNGTTTTLSTNADQLFRLITGSDPDCTVTCKSSSWFENKVLTFTNMSASLDLAQPSSKNVPTSGQASGSSSMPVDNATIPTSVGRLSGITVRYEALKKFDPRSKAFKDAWRDEVKKGAAKSAALGLGDATEAVLKIVRAKVPLDRKKRAQMLKAAQDDPTGNKLADLFNSYFESASQQALTDPALVGDVAKVMQQRAIYRQAWFDALHNAVGNLLTVEYNYNHPTNQPTTSVVKFIYGYTFGNTGVLTFNGAVSFYNGALPAGAKYGQLYYGQVSTEYDRTLSGSSSAIQTQLSLAGYWQYQPHPSVLNIQAGTVAPGTDIPLPNGTQEFVGTAGSLWVTQAKLTVKAKGGINVPIGVSWSNKTDLLQGNKIGAQVGLTYNFSSVAGLFSGGQ
jgi:hypothetical protein